MADLPWIDPFLAHPPADNSWTERGDLSSHDYLTSVRQANGLNHLVPAVATTQPPPVAPAVDPGLDVLIASLYGPPFPGPVAAAVAGPAATNVAPAPAPSPALLNAPPNPAQPPPPPPNAPGPLAQGFPPGLAMVFTLTHRQSAWLHECDACGWYYGDRTDFARHVARRVPGRAGFHLVSVDPVRDGSWWGQDAAGNAYRGNMLTAAQAPVRARGARIPPPCGRG